ncbi:MAG TPA: glycoside hydrolase family 16 protein [Anaerolineae bacterium]
MRITEDQQPWCPEFDGQVKASCIQTGLFAGPVGSSIHPWADPNLTDAFYQDPLDIDATKFHVYAHEWTPTHVDFYVDNQKISRINQSPAYPMQFMLAIYELPGADVNAAYPKEFVVGYVRGYQPEAGY